MHTTLLSAAACGADLQRGEHLLQVCLVRHDPTDINHSDITSIGGSSTMDYNSNEVGRLQGGMRGQESVGESERGDRGAVAAETLLRVTGENG